MKYSYYKKSMFVLAILCILAIVVTEVMLVLMALQIIDIVMIYIPVGLLSLTNLAGILSGYIKVKDKSVTMQSIAHEVSPSIDTSHKYEDNLLDSRTKFGWFGKWIVKSTGLVFLKSTSGTRSEDLSKKVYLFVHRHMVKPLPLDVVKQLAQQA